MGVLPEIPRRLRAVRYAALPDIFAAPLRTPGGRCGEVPLIQATPFAAAPAASDAERARRVDLVVLPPNVTGTNCSNCEYAKPTQTTLYCSNPAVLLPVTGRHCCALWDSPGTQHVGATEYMKDATGREHKPPGTAEGGQFTEGGNAAAGEDSLVQPQPSDISISKGLSDYSDEQLAMLFDLAREENPSPKLGIQSQGVYSIEGGRALLDAAARKVSNDTGIDKARIKMVIQPSVFQPHLSSYGGSHVVESAARVFGLDLSPYETQKIQERKANIPKKRDIDKDFKVNGFSQHVRALSDAEMDSVVRSVYAETQKLLKEAGISKLTVYRGASSGDVGAVSHWTVDPEVAKGFSVGGKVYRKEIPASQVLAVPRTGWGVSSQAEVQVLGLNSQPAPTPAARYKRDAVGNEHHETSGRFVPKGKWYPTNPPDDDLPIAEEIPPAARGLAKRAGDFLANRYKSLEAKYGSAGAKAVLAGMVLLSPTPIPGSSLIPIAIAEGVKRLGRLISGGQTQNVAQPPPEWARDAARQILGELAAVLDTQPATYAAIPDVQPAKVEELGGGKNESKLVTLPGGNRGVFKPVSGEDDDLDPDIPGRYDIREAAASDVARILGMADLVPSTGQASIRGSEGSLQQFVPDAQPAHEAEESGRDIYGTPEDAARAAILDYIIGNVDRHTENWMVRPDGKIVLIDNGLSFPEGEEADGAPKPGFWPQADEEGLVVPPEAASWGPLWWRIDQALRARGLDNDAILRTHRRFEAVVNQAGTPIAMLPAFFKAAPRMDAPAFSGTTTGSGTTPDVQSA